MTAFPHQVFEALDEEDEHKLEYEEMVKCIWNDPLGPYIPVVDRYSWRARAPRSEETLPSGPLIFVRFTHTGTDMTLWPDCIAEVRLLQDEHMDMLGYPDIAYNFLVGGDGTVYEGRGWKTEASRPQGFDPLKGRCLDIGYIGDFTATLVATVQKQSVGHGFTVPIINRINWGAKNPPAPKASYLANHMPVTYIRLTDTGTSGCSTVDECASIIREYQQSYIALGFPDQPFNFLIGGGCVFVGRGWFRRAMALSRNTMINDSCVEIAYIGDFKSEGPPTDMLFIALDLIKYGVKNNNVHHFFKIIEYKPFSLS